MRRPAKIGTFPFPVGLQRFSKDNLLSIIKGSLGGGGKPGILLSGGVDSAVLAILATTYLLPDIPCFVVGRKGAANPDVHAANRLADEKGLNLTTRLFDSKEISDIQQELKECTGSASLYDGDECVFAALKFAAQNNVTSIIATDGIDELMGGYWGHRDRIRFPDIKDAFTYFWDELEEKHLSPMRRAAEFHKLDLDFVYLSPCIVTVLSMIPLEDRIKGGVSKAIWKEFAQMVGVPLWVIRRQKEGFVDAFK